MNAGPEAQCLDPLETASTTKASRTADQPFPIFSFVAGVVLVLSLFVPRLILIVPIIVVVCLATIGIVRKESPRALPILTCLGAVAFFVVMSVGFPIASAPNEPAPDTPIDAEWDFNSYTDTMTDRVTHYATLRDVTGKAEFSISCTSTGLEYRFSSDNFLGDGSRYLQYLFDAEPSAYATFGYSDKDASITRGYTNGKPVTDDEYRADANAEFNRMTTGLRSSQHHRLLVRLAAFDGTPYEYTFALKDAKATIDALSKSCGLAI